MSTKTALIYSQQFSRYSYGDDHPFKLQRYLLAFELMREYGLSNLPGADILDCSRATEQDLLTFHTEDYLNRLREFSESDSPRADFRFGLGDVENPVFKGLYDWACIGAGSTLEAARLVVDEGYDIAFNLAGGYHHAHRNKASGFSYLNDCVVAINRLLEKGKRVAYLDIDAHHGDGVQEAFYATDQVLTVSIHESGVYFFPGTGFENEIGTGKGKGFSVNVPLVEHADDALFMKAFDEVAFPLIAAYNPDVLVTQLGVDAFRTDPLTRLEITTHSYTYILRKLKALKIPWVAVGGGGYDMVNVARGWTLAWAIMNEVELPSKLPPGFERTLCEMGLSGGLLHDAMHWSEEEDRNRALDAVERSIATLRKSVFPVIIGHYGEIAGE